MRLIALATLFLGVVVALPAPEKIAIDDCCCCCDISKQAISCNTEISKADCICPAVVCPTNAPTIFPGVPVPTQQPAPPPTNPIPSWLDILFGNSPKHECCCCDPTQNAITCVMQPGICICPAIDCPTNAPTLWPNNDQPKATTLPKPPAPRAEGAAKVAVDEPSVQGEGAGLGVGVPVDFLQESAVGELVVVEPSATAEPTKTEEPCCCCDIKNERISCEMRDKGDCFCALVQCPDNAPTVWPGSQARETGAA